MNKTTNHTLLIETVTKLVRLTEHPLFHAQTELPEWNRLIGDANELLWENDYLEHMEYVSGKRA